MPNDYAPIDHTAISGLATTASGGVGGAARKGIKGAVLGFLAPIALGALVFGGAAFLFTAGSIGLGIISGSALLGAVLGGFFAPTTAGVGAAVGGVLGGLSGASRASDQVKMERGAAAELQAQIEVAKAQMAAQQPQVVYAQPAPTMAPYGSPMNPANPRGLQAGADTMQYQGPLTAQQLAMVH